MRKRYSLIFLAAVGVFTPLRGSAWDDTGHQVVAQIAWTYLDTHVQDKLVLLFPDDLLSKNHVIFTASSKPATPEVPFPHTTYNHVTIANWMDDLRDNSFDKPLRDWHFVDRPYFDGIPPRLAVPGSPNAREKIIENIHVLRKARFFDDEKNRDRAEDRSKAAYAVAVLIHLIGDVHQPLHCVSRFSSVTPAGDGGGGGFRIKGPAGIKDLHSLWDASGGLFGFVKLKRDFDEQHQDSLRKFVKIVTDQYDPAVHPENKNFNPEEWVEESFVIARNRVYPGIVEGGEATPDYLVKAQQLSAERIAIAGYRLALVLNEVLSE